MDIQGVIAARLYDVTDWGMRHRYDTDDGAKPTGSASEIWRDGRKTYKPTLGLVGARREAMRIVARVFQTPDLDEDELEGIALAGYGRTLTSIAFGSGWVTDAWMSISRCAFLAGVDPTNDAAVAVRGWALHGVVEDAWSWLLEGADLDCALAEASLLLSDGRIPPPSLEHAD